MDEVGTAVIAISLVLIAVFVPTAFIPGISGQFYLQFAITIAVSTAISAFNSLTLSPALAGAAVQAAPRVSGAAALLPGALADARLPTASTTASTGVAHGYSRDRALPGRLAGSRSSPCSRSSPACIYATVYMRADGAARLHPDARPGLCDRRHPAARRRLAGAHRRGGPAGVARSSQETPGVDRRRRLRRLLRRDLHQCHAMPASSSRASSRSSDRLEARPVAPTRSSARCSAACRASRRPSSSRLPPPPIRGIGNAGGFKMQMQERNSADMRPILGIAYEIAGTANQTPGPDRRVHHLLGVEPAVLPRDRPRQGAHAERADPQHLRDAVDQSRHRLCQRLQRLRPRLPGAGAGRPGVPPRARRHPAS